MTSDRLRLMEAADGSIGEAGLQTNVSLALPVVPVEESTGTIILSLKMPYVEPHCFMM